MDVLEMLAGTAGTLTVGGKTYTILPPTPGDQIREGVEMRRLARAAGGKDVADAEDQYILPDGVRWRLWYHVGRSGGTLSRDEANALVTDFNSGPIGHALDQSLKLPGGDEKKAEAPPPGTSGS